MSSIFGPGRGVGFRFVLVGVVCCLSAAQPFKHGDARLEGGEVNSEGRVEVYDSQRGWGTVCDDNWDQIDADVVCRQLGYDNASAIPFFGEGTGPILLRGLECQGNESNLFQCLSFSKRQCDHSNDAGVECAPADDPSTPGSGLDPLMIGLYVLIPFAVLVILLLLIIGGMLIISTTYKREARQIEEQNFQTLRFKGLSLKEQNKQRPGGFFRKRMSSGMSRSSSQFSVERNIPRAALGEGTSHPWQIAVSDSGTELVELVPTVGGTTGPEQPGVHQPTIGILKPLDSAVDVDDENLPKRYTRKSHGDDNDSDSTLDPYD